MSRVGSANMGDVSEQLVAHLAEHLGTPSIRCVSTVTADDE